MGRELQRIVAGLLLITFGCWAEDAHNYLDRVAKTYREVDTFKVKSVASLSNVTGRLGILAKIVHTALFFKSPLKALIESTDSDEKVQSVLVSDGSSVTEYLAWTGEYAITPGTR